MAIRSLNNDKVYLKEFKRKNIVISRMQEYEIKKIE